MLNSKIGLIQKLPTLLFQVGHPVLEEFLLIHTQHALSDEIKNVAGTFIIKIYTEQFLKY
jgi:hypothetical protein